MPIRIPLEVHPITVVVQEAQVVERTIQEGPRTSTRRERVMVDREVPPRQDRASFDRALGYANGVFAPHDIQFHVGCFEPATEGIPGGADRVGLLGSLRRCRLGRA